MNTISIIGTGGIATAIGNRAAKAGYVVEVIGRDPVKAQALADRLAPDAIIGIYGASPSGDIVILAVPYASAAAVVEAFGRTLDGKVIIDVTNPIASDLTGLVTPEGSSGAQEIARHATAGAHVVKAFNTIFGHVLAREGRLDAFIAADDPDAKSRASAFIAKLGLRPLDVGDLAMAGTLEAVALLLIGVARNGAGSFDIALNIDVG
jgi:predicted dinucleotide-binding enzyme